MDKKGIISILIYLIMGKELSPLSHLQPVYASYTDLPKGLQNAIKDTVANRREFGRIRNTGFDFQATSNPDGTYSGIQIKTSPILDGDPNASKWHHVYGLYDKDKRTKEIIGISHNASNPEHDFEKIAGRHRSKLKARGKP